MALALYPIRQIFQLACTASQPLIFLPITLSSRTSLSSFPRWRVYCRKGRTTCHSHKNDQQQTMAIKSIPLGQNRVLAYIVFLFCSRSFFTQINITREETNYHYLCFMSTFILSIRLNCIVNRFWRWLEGLAFWEKKIQRKNFYYSIWSNVPWWIMHNKTRNVH